MPANPLGHALRNRRAGHHTLVWARPEPAKRPRTSPSPALPSRTATLIPRRHRADFSAPTSHPPSPGHHHRPTPRNRAHRARRDAPTGKPATQCTHGRIDPSLSGIPENGLAHPSRIRGLKHGKGALGRRGWPPQAPSLARPHSYGLPTLRLDYQPELPDTFTLTRCRPPNDRARDRTRPARRHLRNPVVADHSGARPFLAVHRTRTRGAPAARAGRLAEAYP